MTAAVDFFPPRTTPPASIEWGTSEYDQHPAARALVEQMTAGTTTRDLTVIWMGEHLVLVRRRGTKEWAARGMTTYYPTRYEARDSHHVNGGHHLPDVCASGDLLPPGFKGGKDDVYCYRNGADVPAALVGRAGSAQAKRFLRAWVARLANLDKQYVVLARKVIAVVEAEETRSAAKARAQQIEERRRAKLAKAAPQMAKALRAGALDLAASLGGLVGLSVTEVLAGQRPHGSGGVWNTLDEMLKALDAAGERRPTP